MRSGLTIGVTSFRGGRRAGRAAGVLALLAALPLPAAAEEVRVKDTDSGPVSKQVNRLDGIPIGISSGAAVWAALQLAKRPENRGKLIVAIVPSSSERYLSTWLFEEPQA